MDVLLLFAFLISLMALPVSFATLHSATARTECDDESSSGHHCCDATLSWPSAAWERRVNRICNRGHHLHSLEARVTYSRNTWAASSTESWALIKRCCRWCILHLREEERTVCGSTLREGVLIYCGA